MSNELKRRFEGKRAVISSGKPEATQIGYEILQKGGNAIDAAVAVGFALGVAEPATSGIGGGGFMTISLPNIDKPLFIDFREHAPAKANANMWSLDKNGKVINRENAIGAKSVSVPGEVAGLIYVLENYGTMSLKEVLEPSIKLAKEGIVVTDMMADMLKKHKKYLKQCPNAKKIFCRFTGYKEGQVFKNSDLAKTLQEIANNGLKPFYDGYIGEAIVDTVQKSGGVLEMSDLRSFEVTVREPVIGNYRGYTIISSPPPSSGGTHIVQTLNILENFNIAEYEVNSAKYIHLFSEAFKLAYKDRAKYMADTSFVKVPLKGLISKKYAKVLANEIDMTKAKSPDVYDPWMYEHEDTTHYSIGDNEGNLVSVTKTINHFFGSCMVAKGTGILLNDTMADFSTNKLDINAVEANKKPLSSMSPTIILKDNKPVAILGSPGGMRIINVVVQVISKIIDHGMDIQEAIESPRITQNASNKMLYENRIAEHVINDLIEMGHNMEKCLDWDKKMGGVNALMYLKDGTIVGGADPRRDGVAYGF